MAKKLLMIIPNLDFGGAQRIFHIHAQILAEKFEVIECAFNLEQKQAFISENRLISLGVPGGRNFLFKAYYFLQRCWRLYRVKKREKPSISISHLEGADYVNLLSFGTEKQVIVVHGSKIHDQEMNKSFGWLRRKFLIPLFYRRADLIVTVSEGIRMELINNFNLQPRKIQVIYNIFPIGNLLNLAEEEVAIVLGAPKKKYRIVASGRLAEPKNFAALLFIIRSLRNKAFPVQLLLIGDGPLKESLLLTCETLSLEFQDMPSGEGEIQKEADVIFLGYQSNPFKFYKLGHLFIMTSMWEGFPLALGEAMALGMPVLSSDCPPSGPLELIDPDWKQVYPLRHYPYISSNGVLLPVPYPERKETIELWVETIMNLLQDKEFLEKIGKSAKVRVEVLSEEVIKEKWLNIDDLLNDKTKNSNH